MIERLDRLAHNVATIRAIVDSTWLACIPMPYDRLLERGRVVRDDVNQVHSGGVTLAAGRQIDADHVVLAPGSTCASPFKPIDDED